MKCKQKTETRLVDGHSGEEKIERGDLGQDYINLQQIPAVTSIRDALKSDKMYATTNMIWYDDVIIRCGECK